jgi:hypothetical protein
MFVQGKTGGHYTLYTIHCTQYTILIHYALIHYALIHCALIHYALIHYALIHYSRKVTLIKIPVDAVDRLLGAGLTAAVREAASVKYARWVENFKDLQKGKLQVEPGGLSRDLSLGDAHTQSKAKQARQGNAIPSPIKARKLSDDTRTPSTSTSTLPLKRTGAKRVSSQRCCSMDGCASPISTGVVRAANMPPSWRTYNADALMDTLIGIPGLPKHELSHVISHTRSLPDLRNRNSKQESPLKLKWASGDGLGTPSHSSSSNAAMFVRGSFKGGFIGGFHNTTQI